MRFKIAVVLVIILFGNASFGQLEASNWYFGFNAGITFNSSTGGIDAKTDGQLNTFEGCTSISDTFGNLLFYSDGITVYNKNHEVMANGNSLFGNSSSSQSALIIPKPRDPNIYYVFTVDTNGQFTSSNGFNYSTVDISLNGGLGEVVTKNTNLLQFTTEKISGVLKDCKDDSIWVITLANENDAIDGSYNTFYAYEINDMGVSATAVKSVIPSFFIQDRRGYLKLSPDGKKLAIANVTDDIYLFDFDVNTGTVSNPLPLSAINGEQVPYGIEFSPNSNLLYVNSSTDVNNISDTSIKTSTLYQFNLTSANIQTSREIIDERSDLHRGALQLGPDGKIYRALTKNFIEGIPFLGVINNPNNLGASSNYVHNGVNLNGRRSAQGLPPFIQSFFNTQIDIINNGSSAVNLFLCEGEDYTLEGPVMAGATYTWTKDGVTLAEPSNALTVSTSGAYKLIINPNNGDCDIEGQAFVVVNPLPQATNATLLQCDDDTDNRTPFNLSQADSKLSTASPEISVSYYLTAAEAQTNINSLDKSSFTNTSNPQTVYARVENTRTGCVNFAELQLEVSSTSIPTIELNVCDDDGNQDGFHSFNLTNAIPRLTASINQAVDVKFYSNTSDALLETNELPSTITNPTAFRSEIYARVENSNNCYGINTVTLNVFRLPQTPVDETTLICTDSVANTISINSGLSLSEIPNHTYLWSTGQTTERIDVNQAGLYTITITNQNGCSTNRNITVEASSSATISGIKTTEGFDMFSITIEAEGTGIYQYAISNPNGFMQGYQDDPNFQGIAAGLYTILVRDIKNNCGIVSQQVSVLGFPKFFTPNSDGFNDTWQVYGVNSEFYNTAQIYIFDRYGKLLKQISPTGSGWDGRYNGRLLPADDYWFSMTLEDGREYRSHFSLRR